MANTYNNHEASVESNTEHALLAFAEAVGLDPDSQADGIETVIGDLIAELLHRAEYEGMSVSSTLAKAFAFYLSEQDAVSRNEDPRDGSGLCHPHEMNSLIDNIRFHSSDYCD